MKLITQIACQPWFNMSVDNQLSFIWLLISSKTLKRPKSFSFASLRNDFWLKANILVNLIKDYPNLGNIIKAVDAAANELDTPPEVLAPIFDTAATKVLDILLIMWVKILNILLVVLELFTRQLSFSHYKMEIE